MVWSGNHYLMILKGPIQALAPGPYIPLPDTYYTPNHIYPKNVNWCIWCFVHLLLFFYTLLPEISSQFISVSLKDEKAIPEIVDHQGCRMMVFKNSIYQYFIQVLTESLSQSHPRLSARGDAKYRNHFSIFLFINTRAIAQHIIFSSCKLAETCTICVVHLFGRDSLFTWCDNVTKL